jgi:hypothetical protein
VEGEGDELGSMLTGGGEQGRPTITTKCSVQHSSHTSSGGREGLWAEGRNEGAAAAAFGQLVAPLLHNWPHLYSCSWWWAAALSPSAAESTITRTSTSS